MLFKLSKHHADNKRDDLVVVKYKPTGAQFNSAQLAS